MSPPKGLLRHLALARIAWKAWHIDPIHTTMFHEKNMESFHILIKELAMLKGPVVKLAQMIAMIPGILPHPYASALLSLCAHGPAMHWSMVLRRMNQELGPQWRTHFLDFEEKPTFAASIGQVHRARLMDGRQVAIKIQYPNMRRTILSDTTLINTLFKMISPSKQSLDLQHFHSEWKTRLMEELDYGLEVRHMNFWSILFKNHPNILIPTPLKSLSSPTVLTMSWIHEPSIQTAFSASADQRNRLGKSLFLAWYTPFFQAAMIHGDPHIGNIAWDNKTSHLSLMDFGCVRIFSPQFIQSFCHLYMGLRTNNTQLTKKAYAEWGFSPLSQEIVQALNLWARFLLAPFLMDKECTLDQISSPQEAKNRLHHVYTALALHGGTQAPGEFLMFDRVAVILGSLLVRLNAKANWCTLMQSLVASFSLDQCTKNQNHLLAMAENNDTVT